jgi:hypothetical protein
MIDLYSIQRSLEELAKKTGNPEVQKALEEVITLIVQQEEYAPF